MSEHIAFMGWTDANPVALAFAGWGDYHAAPPGTWTQRGVRKAAWTQRDEGTGTWTQRTTGEGTWTRAS